MNKQIPTKIIYYLIAGSIILLSFFHHSSLYSPFLNSDDAVVVLMIHDFNFPQDLYFWSANRFGSLIPLAGQFFYKILHFTPIQSEAITHYFLLLFGFLGYASLFKSNVVRLLFAVIWFFPPLRMIDVLKASQGEQYALIGISVFLINTLYARPIQQYHLKENILLLLITGIFIASVWVSDLAIITISIIVFIYTVRYRRGKSANNSFTILKKPELYYIILGFIACALFIYYAKTNAVREENFYSFFDPKIILENFTIFLSTIRDLFLFNIKEPFTSLYTYLLLFIVLISIVLHRKIRLAGHNVIWATIFILDLALVFIVILSSTWAYQNGVPRRYFVCSYISFWLAVLVILDHIQEIKFKWLLYGFVAVTVLLGGLGTFYNYKYISPGSLKPTIEIASEFKSLGKIGIISEYWNSYINAAPEPDNIKATPNDKSLVRKQSYIDSVFSQPQIYVIRDMWMDFFPDTLEQFGYVLVKDGSEFRLGNCQVCQYKKTKYCKTFGLEKLKYDVSQEIAENELNNKVLYFPSTCTLCKEKHVVFGPFIPIGIGDFKAWFYIKTIQNNKDSAFALLDVTADYGKIQLASKKLSKIDFTTIENNYEYIDLDFTTSKRYNGVEFRIYFYGNADLYFDHIKLIEK